MLWKIDPNKSANENLWDCIRTNAIFFKNKAVRGGMNLTKDEWAECIDIVIYEAVKRFMNKLRSGRYNRDMSFFLNVRSSVWEVFYQKVDLYVRNVVHRKIMSVDRLEPDKAEHIRANYAPAKYLSNNIEKKSAMAALKVWQKNSQQLTHIHHEQVDDFWDYIEACYDLGIQINEKNPLYKKGIKLIK